MPPGPPPGMPPNRMHHGPQSHHKHQQQPMHSGPPGSNILSAAPQLTKDTKGMTTITAKPQIRYKMNAMQQFCILFFFLNCLFFAICTEIWAPMWHVSYHLRCGRNVTTTRLSNRCHTICIQCTNISPMQWCRNRGKGNFRTWRTNIRRILNPPRQPPKTMLICNLCVKCKVYCRKRSILYVLRIKCIFIGKSHMCMHYATKNLWCNDNIA